MKGGGESLQILLKITDRMKTERWSCRRTTDDTVFRDLLHPSCFSSQLSDRKHWDRRHRFVLAPCQMLIECKEERSQLGLEVDERERFTLTVIRAAVQPNKFPLCVKQ